MPMALRTRSYDDAFYAWVAKHAKTRPGGAAQGWHHTADPIAATVKPLDRYQELFGKDD
jgi:hypothetical protein